MGFMQRYVAHGRWLCVETHEGTMIYAEGDRSVEEIRNDFEEVTDDDIEYKEGWCWRFSAPGYMDQYPEHGSWCGVYNDERGAQEAADDFEYPDGVPEMEAEEVAP